MAHADAGKTVRITRTTEVVLDIDGEALLDGDYYLSIEAMRDRGWEVEVVQSWQQGDVVLDESTGYVWRYGARTYANAPGAVPSFQPVTQLYNDTQPSEHSLVLLVRNGKKV